MSDLPPFGIIILAAGNSSRLGRPKQFLQYQEKSLLLRVTESALSSGCAALVVVTGAEKESIEKELQHLPAIYTHNTDWADGMASSIISGLNQLLTSAPHLTHVIIAVSDQPFVSAAIFEGLLKTKSEAGTGIVACKYDDIVGAPVLFSDKYFQNLRALRGTEGAKKLLKIFKKDLSTIDFPLGKFDIDTDEDFERLSTIG
jgi:molybdenum cofactor cytidylyltransferase